MLSRRFLILAALASVLMAAVPGSARAQQYKDAEAFVDNLAKQAIDVMTRPGIPDPQRVERFRGLFISSVDLPVVAKFVLGRHWRNATLAQQQEFMRLFEDMLVYTWSTRFRDGAGAVTFQMVDAKADVDNGVVVESRILREHQDPVSVFWRLRRPEGQYKILDLVIAGTSMLFQYRDEYAAVINQTGGIDGMLQTLRKKVAQLSSQVPKQ